MPAVRNRVMNSTVNQVMVFTMLKEDVFASFIVLLMTNTEL